MNHPREALLTPTDSGRASSRRKNQKNALGLVLLIILWGGLVFGGFYIAKNYVDQAVSKVQQTNAMNVQLINERLGTLAADIRNLEEVVASADQSITSTGSTQLQLTQNMIEQLQLQMEEMKRSLEILKEAPNAAN